MKNQIEGKESMEAKIKKKGQTIYERDETIAELKESLKKLEEE
ncbi:MAG: hypothetical protein PV345_01925 [Wolbachia sp.]|nr:hypothetical protein [Wolbachia sp.]